VGVSAGASVAAFLSQGVSPSRLYQALLRGGDPVFPLQQRDVVELDMLQAARIARLGARLIGRACVDFFRRRAASAQRGPVDLPAGFFSLESYRRFFAGTLEANGLSDDFRQVRKRLFIPATDLDSGHRVVFGRPPWDDVPISAAIAASSAIPVFFEPVPIRDRQFIDGNVGRAAHLDLAVELGAAQVLVVSPLVPVENVPGQCLIPPGEGSRTCTSLRERGIWTILNQATRIEHHARLHLGIAQIRAEHPGVDVRLIEPSHGDATMFLANPMSLSARKQILEGAYAQARSAIDRVPQSDLLSWGAAPAVA
jgi:predicted acylesterase/phospholipase RssA